MDNFHTIKIQIIGNYKFYSYFPPLLLLHVSHASHFMHSTITSFHLSYMSFHLLSSDLIFTKYNSTSITIITIIIAEKLMTGSNSNHSIKLSFSLNYPIFIPPHILTLFTHSNTHLFHLQL